MRRGQASDAHVDDVKVQSLRAGEESSVIEQEGQDDEQLNGLGAKFLDSPVTPQDGDVASTSKGIAFVQSADASRCPPSASTGDLDIASGGAYELEHGS